MKNDSLDYTSYYRIALWLSGRLQPLVEGPARPEKERGYSPTGSTSETAQEAVFCPADMQLDELSQRLLWNAFYSNEIGGGADFNNIFNNKTE